MRRSRPVFRNFGLKHMWNTMKCKRDTPNMFHNAIWIIMYASRWWVPYWKGFETFLLWKVTYVLAFQISAALNLSLRLRNSHTVNMSIFGKFRKSAFDKTKFKPIFYCLIFLNWKTHSQKRPKRHLLDTSCHKNTEFARRGTVSWRHTNDIAFSDHVIKFEFMYCFIHNYLILID